MFKHFEVTRAGLDENWERSFSFKQYLNVSLAAATNFMSSKTSCQTDYTGNNFFI
jgi:hypothetical protein